LELEAGLISERTKALEAPKGQGVKLAVTVLRFSLPNITMQLEPIMREMQGKARKLETSGRHHYYITPARRTAYNRGHSRARWR
jgi:hypothetical protein